MIRLADIGVLIALADRNHFQHAPARFWLRSNPRVALATCSLTEMGFLRIYGHPSYPGGPGSAGQALGDLQAYRQRKGHCFLPCDLPFDDTVFTDLADLSSKEINELYLVALAAHHGICFATFNVSIPLDRIHHGTNAIEVISA